MWTGNENLKQLNSIFKMRAVFVYVFFVYAWTLAVGQDINAMNNMPKYDVRYDYLDVDGILDSKRLVRNYVDCLINLKPCTPEGKALKQLLPEALRTKCIRCSPRQKQTAVKVIRRLKYEYPEEWAKLSSRWDPTGDFTRFFEEFLAKETFNTISNTGNEIPGSSSLPPNRPRAPATPIPVRPTPTTVAPTLPPTFLPQPTNSQPPVEVSTPPRPIVLNRFGPDGELITASPSSASATPPSTTTSTTRRPITNPTTIRTRSTVMTWVAAASDSMPTRFPLRPAATDLPPVYTTTITLIDQIGSKIMRTTELVTDILRNTVRAVVGR